MNLKTQVEEAKRIEEVLISQPREKKYVYNNLEYEMVCIRKELERSNTNLEFEKISTTLNQILNC
jgi:hypothetical protein